MSFFSVSVVTPVFNEEAIIRESVITNRTLLKQFGCDYEIIVVNDGSTDRSPEILDESFAREQDVRIIHKKKNEGFGSAVSTGIAAAGKEYIFCIPADSPLTAEVLSAFADAAGKADIIVSYRLERLGYNWRMRLNSRAFHFIVEKLFGLRLRDFNWIHMYHRKVFNGADGIRITSKGLFMLAETLISAHRKGFSFHEIPVKQTQRITGVATASKLSAVVKTMREIGAFYFAANGKT
jgi:glycosyltransferase involved in cell wall biosynthesis